MKLVKTSPEFRSHLAVLNEKQSTHDEISEAGGKLLMMMYGVKHLKLLNRARYFLQLLARQGYIHFVYFFRHSHGMEITSTHWSIDGKTKQVIYSQLGQLHHLLLKD